MKYCPKCNCELPDVAMFCGNCGTNLNEYAAPTEPVSAPVPPVAPVEPVSAPVPPVAPVEPVSAPVPPVAPVEPVSAQMPPMTSAPVTETWINPPKKSKAKLIIIISVIVVLIAGVVVAGFMTDWFGLASKKADTSNVVDPAAEQAKKDEEEKNAVITDANKYFDARKDLDYPTMKQYGIDNLEKDHQYNADKFALDDDDSLEMAKMVLRKYKKLYSEATYTVTDAKKDGDKYTVYFDIKEKDGKVIERVLNGDEFKDLKEAAKEIDEDDKDALNEYKANVESLLDKAIDEAKADTQSVDRTAEKKDGKWVLIL